MNYFIFVFFIRNFYFEYQYSYYEPNREPIIGILTIPTSKNNQVFSNLNYSMIPSSYVKWVEQTGARVVPIKYDMKPENMKKLLKILNGVLITGGSASLFNEDDKCLIKKMLDSQSICDTDYMKTIRFIIQTAIEINDEGSNFPIWTTCLGYEAMILSLSKFTVQRMPINSENHSLNLSLEPSFVKYFDKQFSLQMIKNLQEKPYSFFNHKYAFLPEQFQNNDEIKNDIEILATVNLENQKNVVAMIKHAKYPFYGTQFHPEKIQFEHKPNLNKVQNYDSIEIAHQLAMILYEEAIKNENYIEDQNSLEALLINNFQEMKSSGNFEQIYIFPKIIDLKRILLQFNQNYPCIFFVIRQFHVRNQLVLGK